MTVGFAPGGGTDTAARIIAQKLSENLGQSVVVDNKAGAGGNIAAQHIAMAPPDGYTIHLTSVGPMSRCAAHRQGSRLRSEARHRADHDGRRVPERDRRAFGRAGEDARGIRRARRSRSPASSTYASSGVGGAGHLAGELFKERAGIDMLHVPYKGGGPAMTDLLGGRIDMYVGVPSTVAPHVDAGKLRALATTGAKRTSTMPGVPTVAESGYPGFEATNWYAFVAPGKTPKDLLDFWNRELTKVLNDPQVSAELAKHGLDPAPGTRDELAQYIERESQKWGKVVREAKITNE